MDTNTANLGQPSPPWVGRVQLVLDGGRLLLITHTGYEWTARPESLRNATLAERTAYDAVRVRLLRTPIAGVRP